MEKQKVRATIVVIFAVTLFSIAMLSGSTQSAEMGQLRNAMRGLRRVNNLQFSYVNTYTRAGNAESEQWNIWSDQLTGSWVMEHYITDADGTRLYLKQFCDGRDIYHYIEWTGEWEKQGSQSVAVPYIDGLLELSYDSEDMMDVQSGTEDGYWNISYTFTPEYIGTQYEKNQETVEQSYQDYLKTEVDGEPSSSVELTVEQFKRTRGEDIRVEYTVDPQEVLCKMSCSLTLVQPELLYDIDGGMMLGKEQRSGFLIEFTVNGYNQNGILNKIEQCRNEASY